MPIRPIVAFASALALLTASGAAVAAPSAAVTAAMADPGRPAADVKLDAERHTATLVEFAGVKPGDVVVDVIPGGGYFARIFAKTVGPNGRVVAYVPASVADKYEMGATAKKLAADYPNIQAEIVDKPNPKGNVDVIWIRQNYHDFHTAFFGGGSADVPQLNKAMYDSLKPGGVVVIIDHAAQAGSGVRDANTLHRIDPATVKTELTAAGFTFDGESTVAGNTADDHSKNVFDPAIRGKTDQFMYRFRKPA